ncbi:MAG: hypothetical protein MI861_01385 [Pirellulales bacterium]|nr:hypothetical protein [Pirellulales bacterium]
MNVKLLVLLLCLSSACVVAAAQDSVELGEGKSKLVRDAAIRAWLKPGLVQVLLNKREEIKGLGTGDAQLAKLDAVLDDYVKRVRLAMADAQAIKDLQGQDIDLLKKTLVEEAGAVIADTEEQCNAWIRDNFRGPEFRRIIQVIVRTARGTESLTIDVVAEHLKLSKEQKAAIEKLIDDQASFIRKVQEEKGLDGLRKPSAFVTDAFASFAARLYDILSVTQTGEYLVLGGKVSEGEGLAEFLQRMPPAARDRLLKKSETLAGVWEKRAN